MNDDRTFPLQQGGLDWLCSIYSALNLLHLNGKLERPVDADEKFCDLINNLPKGWNFRRLLTEGIDPSDLHQVLYFAGFGKIEECKDPDFDKLRHILFENFGAIVFFQRKSDGFTHYTVVDGIKKSGEISLFDSFGIEDIFHNDGLFYLEDDVINIEACWTANLV